MEDSSLEDLEGSLLRDFLGAVKSLVGIVAGPNYQAPQPERGPDQTRSESKRRGFFSLFWDLSLVSGRHQGGVRTVAHKFLPEDWLLLGL